MIATSNSCCFGETQIVALPLARFRLVRNSGQTAFFARPCLAYQFTEETIKCHFLVMLSMFAHDMKNSLITVGGFLSRLISGKAGPLTEKQMNYVELMKDKLIFWPYKKGNQPSFIAML